MPVVRPNVSFQRYSATLMRASTDNMAVKIPDSSTVYTMPKLYLNYRKPEKSAQQFLKPMPRVVPKKFRH